MPFRSSSCSEASVVAAELWLPALLELAATIMRFVIATRPNTRTTIAMSASTRVNPASSDAGRRGSAARLLRRDDGLHPCLPHCWATTRPPGEHRHRAPQARVRLRQADHGSGRVVRVARRDVVDEGRAGGVSRTGQSPAAPVGSHQPPSRLNRMPAVPGAAGRQGRRRGRWWRTRCRAGRLNTGLAWPGSARNVAVTTGRVLTRLVPVPVWSSSTAHWYVLASRVTKTTPWLTFFVIARLRAAWISPATCCVAPRIW